MSAAISVIDDAVTKSAAKFGFELKEKQHQALLGFCQGRDVYVSLEATVIENPVVVAVSPNRPNLIKPSQPLEEFAREVAEELKLKKKDYPKTIFCNCYNACSRI